MNDFVRIEGNTTSRTPINGNPPANPGQAKDNPQAVQGEIVVPFTTDHLINNFKESVKKGSSFFYQRSI